jgi:hypothetical protein
MDFANRGTRPANAETTSASASSAGHSSKSSKKGDGTKLTKTLSIVMLFSLTLVAVALIVMFVFGAKNNDESRFIKKAQYQAVFLNGGQVYFGKIGDYTGKYLTLNDIYYLRVNQQVQPGQTSSSATQNDVSLAKLGNELHGPEDKMVINRSEVQFWENLKDDGQVVKAITEYKKNPNAANTQQNTSNTTNTTSTTGNQQQTNTTPTTTTTTKKQ